MKENFWPEFGDQGGAPQRPAIPPPSRAKALALVFGEQTRFGGGGNWEGPKQSFNPLRPIADRLLKRAQTRLESEPSETLEQENELLIKRNELSRQFQQVQNLGVKASARIILRTGFGLKPLSL